MDLDVKKITHRKNNNHFNALFKYLEKFKTNNDSTILSVILPMFNEEKTIRRVLESLPRHELIEVIVVNDNSTDNSLNEIKKIKFPNHIKVVHHQKNKGYGGAVNTGMKLAKGKVVVSMDSDGQHKAKDILTLIKPILNGDSDITIGSRYLGFYNYRLPLLRLGGEILAEKVIRILFRLRIRNNQNGFRAYNKRAIRLLKNARYLDYAFCTEQILKAKINGFKIKECPITVSGREHGVSKITIIKLALNIFSCLLVYYLKKVKVKLAKKSKFFSIIF